MCEVLEKLVFHHCINFFFYQGVNHCSSWALEKKSHIVLALMQHTIERKIFNIEYERASYSV